MLLLRAGDVSKMALPASMEFLRLGSTNVTCTYEEDRHPRVPVTRKKVHSRRTSDAFLKLAARSCLSTVFACLRAGDVSKMDLKNLQSLDLRSTQVTGPNG